MHQLIRTPGQVGEILRRRRKSQRRSQSEVAAKLGLSQGRYSSVEADPAGLTLERLITLASLLGLEIVIRDRSDTPKSPSEW